jgi:CRP-like cAMP-binding protein
MSAARDNGGIRNKLLGLLPTTELETLLQVAEMVTIDTKEMLWEPEEAIRFVYFPEDCVISLVTYLKNGDTVEAMTVGNDGFAGMALYHGLESSRLLAVGQISGQSRRIAAKDFRKLVSACEGLSRILQNYSQFVFETVSQSAACNRLHVIEQRCARWLLMSHDRVGRDHFNLTQESLAEMLGVRRPGVTVAIGILEKAGLIAHRRGNITVVDRAGLEKASCECYDTIMDRQMRLFS